MSESGLASSLKEEACPACGGPMQLRQAHANPVALQLVFAASFLAFLFLVDRLRGQYLILGAWTAVQIVMGAALVRGRLRARKRILRCIRCSATLR